MSGPTCANGLDAWAHGRWDHEHGLTVWMLGPTAWTLGPMVPWAIAPMGPWAHCAFIYCILSPWALGPWSLGPLYERAAALLYGGAVVLLLVYGVPDGVAMCMFYAASHLVWTKLSLPPAWTRSSTIVEGWGPYMMYPSLDKSVGWRSGAAARRRGGAAPRWRGGTAKRWQGGETPRWRCEDPTRRHDGEATSRQGGKAARWRGGKAAS